MAKLVHKATGEPVYVGEEITDFRGDKAVVDHWEEPRNAASSGRLYVYQRDGEQSYLHGYYPSAFNCEFIERTDR